MRALRTTADQIAQTTAPAILHWQGDHFVVLEEATPRQVTIVDPAIGRRRLLRAEFAQGFSGVALALTPGPGFAGRPGKARQPRGIGWRTHLARMAAVAGVPGLLARIFAASLFLQLLGLTLPVATSLIVDWALPAGAASGLGLAGLAMLLLVLAQAALAYARGRVVLTLWRWLDGELMHAFLRRLLSLPFTFFQERSSGDLLLRLESNAAIRETLTTGLLTSLLDGLFVSVYLLILFAAAPLFGAIVLVVALAQLFLLLGTAERLRQYTRISLAARAREESYLVESLRGIETLKASGAEAQVFAAWQGRFAAALESDIRRSHFALRVESLLSALHTGTPLLLLWIGAHAVWDGTLTPGVMLGLVVLAASVLEPLGNLAAGVQQMQTVAAQLERLAEVLAAPPEQPATGLRPTPRLSGCIELENVSFRYSAGTPWVLRNLSLRVAPGETVVIVGPTGAGKSTLLRLLLGLYEPTEGVIRYDGMPLASLERASLRRQIGTVLQESFLLSGTIGENIALHDPEMPQKQVERAAELAGIHAEIVRLPMGYNSRVAEGGSALSGGQRQRLVLARALACQPAILLLDEATSHLDSVTEAEVTQKLAAQRCTRLVVAHRSSSLPTADRVLVLERGCLTRNAES